MPETPLTSQVTAEPGPGGVDGYDPVRGERLARWVESLRQHAADARKAQTREAEWAEDWRFLSGAQWEDRLPSFRRPIVMNVWRRALHIVLAWLVGGRPILKLVPQGVLPPERLVPWQHALWALVEAERVMRKYADALAWAQVGDGGWLKVGWGSRGDPSVDPPDVRVAAPHPAKVYPDPECTDPALEACAYVLFRDTLDLSTLTRRYPQTGWRVGPEAGVSWSGGAAAGREGGGDAPGQAGAGPDRIAPAGGWSTAGGSRRARATVTECWIDDPSLEVETREEVVNLGGLVDQVLARLLPGTPGLDPYALPGLREQVGGLRGTPTVAAFGALPPALLATLGLPPLTPEVRPVRRWVPKYPYGRAITTAGSVVLRDIANPFGPAWGWARRWPFVFVAGAEAPHTVWRPGLLADLEELQRAINKAISLDLENFIKVTNAIVIGDEAAMDDEDWDDLSLVPGVKIRKRLGTNVQVVFPQPLPAQAMEFPDYLARKLEQNLGIHDPQLPQGQAVAARTVELLTQKGNFVLGAAAKLGDEALSGLAQRLVGLMQAFYVPGRMIPLFEGERVGEPVALPELPAGLRLRVEASSAFGELMASAQAMAAAAQGKKKGG